MMQRAILAAALLIPAITQAQAPASEKGIAVQMLTDLPKADAEPTTCLVQTTLSMSAGNDLTGPLNIGVKDGIPVIVVEKGAKLHGPFTIMVCDGRVWIKPWTDLSKGG
jgi:hypothetical protein